jgi:asparagine synthase (glutamine-hydrolysing)
MEKGKKTLTKENGPVDYTSLQEKLEQAIAQRIPNRASYGVAFSGGLDSGLLAYLLLKQNPTIPLVVVGFPGSKDVERATILSEKWGAKLVTRTLNEKEFEKHHRLAGKLLQTEDALQRTLGAVNLSIAQWASENRINTLFVGSGADELFCGYDAFNAMREDPKGCEKLRKNKVENVHTHDVQREVICARHYGIRLESPYLDEAFMKEALKTPAIQNLQGKYGKWRKGILRTLAEKMGAPKEIIEEPKKAMQYGSGAIKALKSGNVEHVLDL